MLHPAISRRESPIQGFGLFADEFIPKGTVVWKLDERDRYMSYEEFLQQPPEVQRLCHVHGTGFMLAGDGSEVMNHHCDPNTANVGDDTLVAIRDIQPGEEVTYDYATSEIDPHVFAGWECRCGAANCRHYINARDCLDEAFQARWAGHFPSWTLSFIERHGLSV